MAQSKDEQIIIVGCGRVGVALAQSICRQGHQVVVLDCEARAFDRLGPDFRGRTVEGDALDHDALRQAGIETVHGLAAVTGSDSVNIVTGRVACHLFNVEHVVARVYDPLRAPIYEMMGLQTVAATSWGAKRIEQLLLHPGLQSVYVAGNGEVQIYEITVPDSWKDRRLSEVVPAGSALPVAVSRGGRELLPAVDFLLQPGDVLQVSATAEGASILRAHLPVDRKE